MHTVTKAITEHVRDPELMVHSFRAMFGKQPVEFYVQQRPQMAEADRLDADNMQRFEFLKANDSFNDPHDSRNMSIVARVRNRIARAHDQAGWELTAQALY